MFYASGLSLTYISVFGEPEGDKIRKQSGKYACGKEVCCKRIPRYSSMLPSTPTHLHMAEDKTSSGQSAAVRKDDPPPFQSEAFKTWCVTYALTSESTLSWLAFPYCGDLEACVMAGVARRWQQPGSLGHCLERSFTRELLDLQQIPHEQAKAFYGVEPLRS